MQRLVMKFGGSSMVDAEHIRKVADIVVSTYEIGHQVVVVVSAMGHSTDDLIAQANKITPHPDPRELDMLLATGEQVSIALLSMAVQSYGRKARSFTGALAGIVTEPVHGSARIHEIQSAQLEQSLERGEIPIVAGFQGITEDQEITTLGRGGSDTTAVALASALKAERCDIYTDVDGVYTADPRRFKGASKLTSISYEEMLALSVGGAQVLSVRSVELAMLKEVQLRVRSTFAPDDEGTLIASRSFASEHLSNASPTVDSRLAETCVP